MTDIGTITVKVEPEITLSDETIAKLAKAIMDEQERRRPTGIGVVVGELNKFTPFPFAAR